MKTLTQAKSFAVADVLLAAGYDRLASQVADGDADATSSVAFALRMERRPIMIAGLKKAQRLIG